MQKVHIHESTKTISITLIFRPDPSYKACPNAMGTSPLAEVETFGKSKPVSIVQMEKTEKTVYSLQLPASGIQGT